MKNLDSGFNVKNIVLAESSFYRLPKLSFGEEVNNVFDINVEVAIDGKIITVYETVALIQKFQDVEQFKFIVKMIGVFECTGESQITDFDEFGKINGAAIIFPYIREYVTNISLRAGIGTIILPPINFTKMEKRND